MWRAAASGLGITLAPGKTFTLKQVNNTTNNWNNGLPAVAAAGGPLTIVGNGDIIERSMTGKTAAFRLFEVRAGASLSLQNLTLQGGSAYAGGAVYSRGTLTMTAVTVQKNTASVGGGIYSDGSLVMHDCLVQNNQVIGVNGADGYLLDFGDTWRTYIEAEPGGWGFGGGIYVAGGTAELLGTTATHNTAKGGRGGHNKYGHPNAPDGIGQGGGIYIESDAAVVLDAFTVAHVIDNSADVDPDISGTFSIS